MKTLEKEKILERMYYDVEEGFGSSVRGVAVSMGEAAKALLFEGVKAGCDVVLRGRRGTSSHSHVSAKSVESRFVWLSDRRSTSARLSEKELHSPWQAQHFGDLHHHFVWQAQRFRRVVLSAFANRIVRAASSGVNVQIPWQAWDIVRVWFYVANVAFGEDPSCVECHFSWQA